MLWKHWEESLSCHQNHNNYVSKIITAWCRVRLIPSDMESSLPADKSNCRLPEIWDKINHRAQALCPLEFHQINANSASPRIFFLLSMVSLFVVGKFLKGTFIRTCMNIIIFSDSGGTLYSNCLCCPGKDCESGRLVNAWAEDAAGDSRNKVERVS